MITGIKTVVVTLPEVYCKLDGCQDMKEMREECARDAQQLFDDMFGG